MLPTLDGGNDPVRRGGPDVGLWGFIGLDKEAVMMPRSPAVRLTIGSENNNHRCLSRFAETACQVSQDGRRQSAVAGCIGSAISRRLPASTVSTAFGLDVAARFSAVEGFKNEVQLTARKRTRHLRPAGRANLGWTIQGGRRSLRWRHQTRGPRRSPWHRICRRSALRDKPRPSSGERVRSASPGAI